MSNFKNIAKKYRRLKRMIVRSEAKLAKIPVNLTEEQVEEYRTYNMRQLLFAQNAVRQLDEHNEALIKMKPLRNSLPKKKQRKLDATKHKY